MFSKWNGAKTVRQHIAYTFMHVQILHACAHVASVEGMGLHAQNVALCTTYIRYNILEPRPLRTQAGLQDSSMREGEGAAVLAITGMEAKR